jgi:hypothetical protein
MSFKGVEINGKTRKKRMTDTWRPSVFFKIWMGGIAERFVVEENSLWYLFSLKKNLKLLSSNCHFSDSTVSAQNFGKKVIKISPLTI